MRHQSRHFRPDPRSDGAVSLPADRRLADGPLRRPAPSSPRHCPGAPLVLRLRRIGATPAGPCESEPAQDLEHGQVVDPSRRARGEPGRCPRARPGLTRRHRSSASAHRHATGPRILSDVPTLLQYGSRVARPGPWHHTKTSAESLALPRSRHIAHELGTSQAECRVFESRLPLRFPPFRAYENTLTVSTHRVRGRAPSTSPPA